VCVEGGVCIYAYIFIELFIYIYLYAYTYVDLGACVCVCVGAYSPFPKSLLEMVIGIEIEILGIEIEILDGQKSGHFSYEPFEKRPAL